MAAVTRCRHIDRVRRRLSVDHLAAADSGNPRTAPTYRDVAFATVAQDDANLRNLTTVKRRPMNTCRLSTDLAAHGRYQVTQTGDVAMSTKSNIAVIAAFLTALAGPAYATNGDIGLSDHGQDASQGARPSFTDTQARASVDTRRESPSAQYGGLVLDIRLQSDRPQLITHAPAFGFSSATWTSSSSGYAGSRDSVGSSRISCQKPSFQPAEHETCLARTSTSWILLRGQVAPLRSKPRTSLALSWVRCW